MTEIEQLKSWMARDLFPLNVQIILDKPDTFEVKIYTLINQYTIICRHYRGRQMTDNVHFYLACSASCRLCRPGEEWHRGNDLPDGKMCEDTWHRILAGIVRYESQYIQKGVTLDAWVEKTAKVPVATDAEAPTVSSPPVGVAIGQEPETYSRWQEARNRFFNFLATATWRP